MTIFKTKLSIARLEVVPFPGFMRLYLRASLSNANSNAHPASHVRSGRDARRTPCPKRLRTPARPKWMASLQGVSAMTSAPADAKLTRRFQRCLAGVKRHHSRQFLPCKSPASQHVADCRGAFQRAREPEARGCLLPAAGRSFVTGGLQLK